MNTVMDTPLATSPTQGGALLLAHLQREVRNSLPPAEGAALTSFIRRNCRVLSARLDEWILTDALKNSRAALPDDVLFGSDWAAMKDSLLPLLGNYWAMDALVRRATERGPVARASIAWAIESAMLPKDATTTGR